MLPSPWPAKAARHALSLEDQEALYRRWLAEHTDLPYRLTMISGRGSGECLDRQEALRAENEVESRTYDLVIAEDLGRIFRRIHARLFCELCEDVGTRLIALNDHVDIAQDNWRVLAGFASMRHEMYNAEHILWCLRPTLCLRRSRPEGPPDVPWRS